MQSVGKKETGIKLIEHRDFISIAVFPNKEEARSFLKDLIIAIKDAQKMGTRSERNLDPTFDGGLDFLVLPCKVEVDEDQMIKRGWKI